MELIQMKDRYSSDICHRIEHIQMFTETCDSCKGLPAKQAAIY